MTGTTRKPIVSEDNSPIERKNTKINDPFNENNHTTSKTLAGSSNPGNVNVVCRFRPLNEKEKNISKDFCVDFINESKINLKSQGENNTYNFSFDRIFNPSESQEIVYNYAAKPIIESVLEGFNGTIFAYGQTSSGKTFTMQGEFDNLEMEGIIPRMIRHVFSYILDSSEDLEYTVKVSMLEIYQEKIRDLINTERVNLHVREDKAKGIYVEDLSEHYVASQDEVLEIMKIGSDNRASGATNMNEHSSRSHSIFVMTIHQNNIKDLSAKTGKLYLVDLAGSEKTSKTGATGLTLEEAKMINKSLTTLGMVINNLTDGKSTHIPYRESKLTRVLQESLGGNAKTCLIITCSPSVYNDAESLSTLRFGVRAKKIKNKPKINKETTVAELKIEIERLEMIIKQKDRRINQLETTIKNSHIPLPKEDDKVEINQEANEDSLTEDNTHSDETKRIIYVQKETEYIPERSTVGFGLVTDQLKTERELNKIQQDKLVQMNTHLETLEEDKKNLNEKLEIAIKNIKESTFEIESKENVLDKLQKIQETFAHNENQLKLKITELENYIQQNIENEKVSNNEEKDILYDDYENMSHNSLRQTIMEDKTVKPEKIQTGEFSAIKQLMKRLEQADERPREIQSIIDEYKNKISEMNDDLEFNIKEQCQECEILKQQMNESLDAERKRADNEKKIILKALEEKSEKFFQYENENIDLLDYVKKLESKINPDDKNFVKKILILEKNMDQLNKMFQQAVAQKSVVIIDKDGLEKKLKEKNERINILETEVNELNDQIKVRDEKMSLINRGPMKNFTSINHMVRKIKGGHAKQSTYMLLDEYRTHY